MRGRSFKLTNTTLSAVVMIMLLLSTFPIASAHNSRMTVTGGVPDIPGAGIITGIGVAIGRIIQLDDETATFNAKLLGYSESRDYEISYSWKFSDGQKSDDKNPVKSFEYSGTNGKFNASLTVCHERACSQPITQNFTMYRWTWIYAIIISIVVVGGLGILYATRERRKGR